MFRIGILMVAGVLSSAASATEGWFIRNAEIERVSVFQQGSLHGMHLYFRAGPHDVEEFELGSGCAPTWEQGLTQSHENKVVTWRSTSAPGAKAQLMYATALAAQAQGLKVDIWVDTRSCINDSRQWGYLWDGTSIAGY